MYAKKANKVYPVNSVQEMKNYLARGFDIFDDHNNIVKHNSSKTIAYTEYERLLEENKDLRAELAELHQQLNGETPELPIGDDPDALPEDDAAPKTLPPAADDSTPKMGGKAAKAKVASGQPDGDAK